MSILATAPTTAFLDAQGTRPERAARFTELAEAITQDPDTLPAYSREIATLTLGARSISEVEVQAVLDAFEDFRAAWEELDDFQAGRLTISQIDPDACGSDADAIEETCEQNVREELSHLLRGLARRSTLSQAA